MAILEKSHWQIYIKGYATTQNFGNMHVIVVTFGGIGRYNMGLIIGKIIIGVCAVIICYATLRVCWEIMKEAEKIQGCQDWREDKLEDKQDENRRNKDG